MGSRGDGSRLTGSCFSSPLSPSASSSSFFSSRGSSGVADPCGVSASPGDSDSFWSPAVFLLAFFFCFWSCAT
jgi:hypothetical protein